MRRGALRSLAALLPLLPCGCSAVLRTSTPQVWLNDDRAEVAATSTPGDASLRSGPLVLEAGASDVAAFQVALSTSAGPTGPYVVELTDFEDGRGGRISSSTVRWYRARYVRVTDFPSWYPAYTGRGTGVTYVPDVLVPFDPASGLRLDGLRNEIVWGEVQAGSPGVYSATLRVRPQSLVALPIFEQGVRLRVHAVNSAAGLPVIARCDPRELLTTRLGWPDEEAARTQLNPALPEHQAAIALVRAAFSLLGEHGVQPVLWGSFPKYDDRNDGGVDIDWGPYEALVAPWIESAVPGGGPRYWPIPASLEYPDAERYGGFESARYAKTLANYIAACERRFAEKGWRLKAFVRPGGPRVLDGDTLEVMRRLGGIHTQSETTLPLALHCPPSSLKALGWHDAPSGEAPEVDYWINPAMWIEPQDAARQAALGRQTWMMPDAPPFSGSLRTATSTMDPQVIPWIAYRYAVQAIWIEHALSSPTRAERDALGTAVSDPLVYAGAEWGSAEPVIPSARLKRLRRGLSDYLLLRALEQSGRKLLAQSTAEQIVRWGLSAASSENLLATREAGWSLDPEPLRFAQRRILQELGPLPEGTAQPVATAPPTSAPSDARAIDRADDAEWARLMGASQRVTPEVRGVRLVEQPHGLLASAFVAVSNTQSRPVEGTWSMPAPPVGWSMLAQGAMLIEPQARKLATLPIGMEAFSFNADGAYELGLIFATDGGSGGANDLSVDARVAIAACPATESAPTIDGELTDWAYASNNAAGDFRLVRSSAGATNRPSQATQAFFLLDSENLYVAVRAAQAPGVELVWRSDNEIEVDGGVPWGQDLIEVLLDPRGVADGTSGDIYCLQIKPNGLLIANQGCRTKPPMGPVKPWPSSAKVATSRARDAWIAEMSIPIASFGAKAQQARIWGCNVTRLDARNGEYSSWSGARSTCYLPLTLGNLVMQWP